VKTSLHPYKDKIPEVFADLADIEESCHTAVDILTDLLTYEKLEAGLMTLERSRVPVVDLIEKALAPFRIQARNKQIHMDLTYSNSIESVALRDHTVEVDTTKMSQVVRNLCSNAIKFTPKHGSVDVSCIFIESQGQSVVQLVFKDSGCGMAAEDLLRLFGEGVQFNASTNQGGGGSGMGLWISKKIVELHGGIIVASSEGAGLGSSFKLELGLLQPPHNGAPQHIPNNTPVMESSAIPTNVFVKERSSTSTKHPSFPQWQLGSNNMAKVVPYELSPNDVLRFLLVDDSALTRRMINRLLVSRGHSCIEAEDGDDAVKKYQAADGAYDVILMDNLMPNCTGPEASKKLRDQGYRGLIIGATGNCLPEEVQAFMDTGVDKVMNKPVSADDLLSTIKELKAQSSRNTYA
jgi:CheY-like chemotaxis protein